MVMVKYWLLLFVVVMGLIGTAGVPQHAQATTKREKAVAVLEELRDHPSNVAVGEKFITYNEAIRTLLQKCSKNETSKAFNALMLELGDDVSVLDLEKVSEIYFDLDMVPKPKAGGTYTDIKGFVYSVSGSGNESKAAGTVYFWNESRTILLYKFQATASTGYAGRIWVQRYDCRAMATATGKYSAWRDNYLPSYPSAILNFYVYN